jgi:hypothetical protein
MQNHQLRPDLEVPEDSCYSVSVPVRQELLLHLRKASGYDRNDIAPKIAVLDAGWPSFAAGS